MKNLATKLLAFQKEVGAIPKDEINPYFQSKYADINTFISIVKPILSKNGLVLLQPLGSKDNKSVLSTLLIDSETGEQILDSIFLPESTDAQKMGGIITYFRRYAIQSLLCLEAEDDDGNSSSQQTALKPQTLKYTPQPAKPSTMPIPDFLNDDEDPFVDEKPKQKFAPRIIGENCNDCGKGKYALNPKTNKIFCDQKCFLTK